MSFSCLIREHTEIKPRLLHQPFYFQIDKTEAYVLDFSRVLENENSPEKFFYTCPLENISQLFINLRNNFEPYFPCINPNSIPKHCLIVILAVIGREDSKHSDKVAKFIVITDDKSCIYQNQIYEFKENIKRSVLLQIKNENKFLKISDEICVATELISWSSVRIGKTNLWKELKSFILGNPNTSSVDPVVDVTPANELDKFRKKRRGEVCDVALGTIPQTAKLKSKYH